MIVSHKHKFIFIKTFKTGGTSAEILLSRYTGPEDILSELGEDEGVRTRLTGKSAQGPGWSLDRLKRTTLRGLLKGKIGQEIREHAKAHQVRKMVGETVWNEYFKFTIVRNPYDRMISRYYYSKSREGSVIRPYQVESLNQMIRYNANFVNENWPVYTVGDRIAVDFVARYETMDVDLKEVARRTGLPQNLHEEYKGIVTKSEFRKDRADKLSVLDQDSVEIIYRLCIKEFEHFGYSRDPSLTFSPDAPPGLGDGWKGDAS